MGVGAGVKERQARVCAKRGRVVRLCANGLKSEGECARSASVYVSVQREQGGHEW